MIDHHATLRQSCPQPAAGTATADASSTPPKRPGACTSSNVNGALGNLQDVVTAQAAAYLRGVVVARDTTAPFAVRIVRSRLCGAGARAVTAKVTLRDGRTRTLVTSLRRCA